MCLLRVLAEKYLHAIFFSRNDTQLIYNMSFVMCLMAVFVSIMMIFQRAPYGRYYNRKFGFSINARLAWIVQESPSMLIPLSLLLDSKKCIAIPSSPNLILLSMFILHYFHRSLIFPLLLKNGSPASFSTFISAFLFTCYNGFLQSWYITNLGTYPLNWTEDIRFRLGAGLFALGILINLHSDNILRGLRKPGETDYKIPFGGLFNYISGANFFGEIIEWWGFAMATWSFPAVSFALFSTLFLGWRACHHHVFYLEKFDDYPKNRKAIIPFLL